MHLRGLPSRYFIKKTGVSTKMIKNQNQSLIVLLVFTWEPKTKKLVYVMFSCFFYVGGCLALVRLFAFFSLNKIRAQTHSKKNQL
jgi:hypothetical protein